MPSKYYKENIESLAADFESLGGLNAFIRPKQMAEIIDSLAFDYNISPKTVRNWLYSINFLHKKGTVHPQYIFDTVMEMIQEGYRVSDIAKLVYKVKASVVSTWAKQAGIKPATFRRSRRLPDLEPMNINRATLEEMIETPEIGEETASKIIKARPFRSLNAVDDLFGVGSKKMLKIDRYFYVGVYTEKEEEIKPIEPLALTAPRGGSVDE